MDAARILYGEIELDAKDSLSQIGQLDEGFEGLKETFIDTQDTMDSLGSSLTAISMFAILGTIIYELISNTESFKLIIEKLTKAFQPLIDIIGEFAEYIGNIMLDVILDVIDLFGEFVSYLTETEQGIALLKTAVIFFVSTAGVLLIASLNTITASAYETLTAFTAMIVPMLPFIAIAALVAAAITTVVLVLEDLYYFATGEKESVAGDFFAMLGLSKEEIEDVRKSIKEFIDNVKEAWDGFTKGVGKLVPAFKKIFGTLFSIAKNFFVEVFKLGFDLVKVFSGVIDIIRGLFTGNFDLILNGFKKIGNAVLSIFQSMSQYVIGLFNDVMELIEPLKEIVKGLFNADLPGKKPIAGARAEGGGVKAGESYLVGEKGTEIFSPSSNGVIIPNSQLSNTPMGGKTTLNSIIGNITIMINSTDNLKEDLGNKIKEIIRQASIEAGQELGIII